MSTTSRGTAHGSDLRALSIILIELLIVIHCAKAIDYAAYRKDAIPRGVTRETARTTRDILEELNVRRAAASHDLQDGTEHLLQYGALLRTQILDTFGRLVYDHYDDFSMSQIEALYRIYRDTLERRYNIFDIVPMILDDPDTRPTKICAHINDRVRTCLRESSEACMNIEIHDYPHPATVTEPALNVTRQIYRLAEIPRHYPNGFSLEAVLDQLRARRIRLTPALFSGLLHNVQYDSFDDRVRTAERELVLFLNRSPRHFASKMTEEASAAAGSVSQLLKGYLTDSESIFGGRAAEQAAYLAQHVVREVDAVSENIELLGAVYDNASINLGYLFKLILPNDTVDRDVLEARDYLVREVARRNIVEDHLRVEKYQQAGPDQLLMEILGQLRDIQFAEDIVSSLHCHARFWHRSHMIENLNELLELFDAYENLRGSPDFAGLMEVADTIRDNLRDTRNVTVQLLCTRPRACLRIGLEIVSNCSAVNEKIKGAIAEFVERTSCGCSCLVDDPQAVIESTTRMRTGGEVTTTKFPPAIGDKESGYSTGNIGDKPTIIYSSITETISKSVEISTSSSNVTDNDDDYDTDSGYNYSSEYDESSSEETGKDSAEVTTVPGNNLPVGIEGNRSTEARCKGTDCIPEVTECSGVDCSTARCTGDDCPVQGNCTGAGCTVGKECVGPLCQDRGIGGDDCDGPDCELNNTGGKCIGADCPVNSKEIPLDCEGSDCVRNSTDIDCVGPDCFDASCADGNCEVSSGKSSCEGDDCESRSCEGDDCESRSCKGDDCVSRSCEGDDCESRSCKGDDCVSRSCEGDDCVSRSCEGDDCVSRSCEGDDCESRSCKGDDCVSRSCEGDDCGGASTAGNSCVGPDCTDGNKQCQGGNCPGNLTACTGEDCSMGTHEETCSGPGCSANSTKLTDCEGGNSKTKMDDSCEGENCFDATSEEEGCEGPDCSDESSININCNGPDCDVSFTKIKCQGSDCSDSESEFNPDCEGADCPKLNVKGNCKGPDCPIVDGKILGNGIKIGCEGAECSISTVQKGCDGPDCPVVGTQIKIDCEGPDCVISEGENDCQGPDCPTVGKGITIDCEGAACPKLNVKGNCEGPDCPIVDKGITIDCEGADCPKLKVKGNCEGPDCPIVGNGIKIDCEGADCPKVKIKNNCEGSDCPIDGEGTVGKGKKIDCDGADCSISGEGTSEECEGDDCSESESNESLSHNPKGIKNETKLACEGADCTISPIENDCDGPDCPIAGKTVKIDCKGADCPISEGENNCEGPDCPIVGNGITIDCEGADCPKLKVPDNCEGSDCPIDGEGTVGKGKTVDCDGADCSISGEVTSEECEGDDCSESDSNESLSRNPKGIQNETELACEGADCSKLKLKGNCEGPDCPLVGEEIPGNGIQIDCEGADCPISTVGKSCDGPDCPIIGTAIKIDCEGPDCVISEGENNCHGPDCPIVGKGITIDCEGAACPKLKVKGTCEGPDCPIVDKGIKIDCEGADCPKLKVKGNCEGPDCPIVDKGITIDCEGADCPKLKVNANCEGQDCPIIGKGIKIDCEGADCPKLKVNTNCEGLDCPIDGEETVGKGTKVGCEGADCPVSKKDDCVGPDCPRDKDDSNISCDGADCSISWEDASEGCEGDDCSESDSNESPCIGPECSTNTEMSCPGGICPTRIPPPTSKGNQTESSTNTHNQNQVATFCDHSDPHYKRKLKRLQKMRRIDADSSTPRIWSAIFASPNSISDTSSSSPRIESDEVNQSKNPLLRTLGVKVENFPPYDSTMARSKNPRDQQDTNQVLRYPNRRSFKRPNNILAELGVKKVGKNSSDESSTRRPKRIHEVLQGLQKSIGETVGMKTIDSDGDEVVSREDPAEDEFSHGKPVEPVWRKVRGDSRRTQAWKTRKSIGERVGMKTIDSDGDEVISREDPGEDEFSHGKPVEPVWRKVRGDSGRTQAWKTRKVHRGEYPWPPRDGHRRPRPRDGHGRLPLDILQWDNSEESGGDGSRSGRMAPMRRRAGSDSRKVYRRGMKLRSFNGEVRAEASAARWMKSRRSYPRSKPMKSQRPNMIQH